MYLSISALILAALFIAGLACAWRAAQTARTPQGAMGWVIFLVSAPWFAVPAYLILGHHKFRAYVTRRKHSAEVVESLRRFGKRYAPMRRPKVPVKAFERIAEMPVVGGNGMALYTDGREAFDAMLAEIAGAEHYVLVQFYILREDGLGRELRDAMVAAAERGVDVMLQYDQVGSHGLPKTYRQRLLKAGIDVPVRPVEHVGLDGDMLEAQAFAYLAVRSLRGLPISWPGTTGVPTPQQGGRLMPADC